VGGTTVRQAEVTAAAKRFVSAPMTISASGAEPDCGGELCIDFQIGVLNCFVMLSFATFCRGLCHAGNLIAGN
jgi:hypothetical protein